MKYDPILWGVTKQGVDLLLSWWSFIGDYAWNY